MNKDIDNFFDCIQRNIENLHNKPEIDNEAMRHDLIIRPILTNAITLGWQETEIQSQQSIDVPTEIKKSYIWAGAIPQKKRPDMIIVPSGYDQTVVVIEEKQLQRDLKNLKGYLSQLIEYQCLHNVVWGLLTDGEKWILQRNFQVFHTFESIKDLKNNLRDLQACIAKKHLMDRIIKHNTPDLITIISIPYIEKGGIKFDPNKIDLFHPIENIEIANFTPVVLKITPINITDLRPKTEAAVHVMPPDVHWENLKAGLKRYSVDGD